MAGFEEEEEHRRLWAAAYGTPAAKAMRKPKEGAEVRGKSGAGAGAWCWCWGCLVHSCTPVFYPGVS